MTKQSSHQPTEPDETFWRIEVAILPGKLDDFLSIVRELKQSTAQEPGTLDYKWFLNSDKTACHTYERYRNSQAVIAHAETFGRLFAGRFLQTCRQTGLDVYGAPTPAAKTLLDGYKATYYSQV